VARRQVFDLPPITFRVNEQATSVPAPAPMPRRGAGPGAVRPRILAVIVYLYMGQYLSKARTATAMSELFNTPVSEGTVGAATAASGAGLTGFMGQAAQQIATADVAHFGRHRVPGTGQAVLVAFGLHRCVRPPERPRQPGP